MNQVFKFALAGVLMLGLHFNAVASDKTNNTIIGAGLGAAAGAVLSDGDPIVILGSAAAGGALGHVLTNDNKKKYKRHGHRNYKHATYRHDNGRHLGHYKNKKHKKHKKYKKHYYR